VDVIAVMSSPRILFRASKEVGVVLRELCKRPRVSPKNPAHGSVNCRRLPSRTLVHGQRNPISRFVEAIVVLDRPMTSDRIRATSQYDNASGPVRMYFCPSWPWARQRDGGARRDVAGVDERNPAVARGTNDLPVVSDRTCLCEHVLHEHMGTKDRPTHARRHECRFCFVVTATDGQLRVIGGAQRGSFHDVLDSSPRRRVDRRDLQAGHVGMVAGEENHRS
jgi:hypothetical protein